MDGSRERVLAVINGQAPDRTPLYELLRNDAVLSHFSGEELTAVNAEEVVFRAYAPAVDATRPRIALPAEESTTSLEDGREQRVFRWTTWTEHTKYADSQAYAAAKKTMMDQEDPTAWTPQRQQEMDEAMVQTTRWREQLGEVFLFPSGPCLGLMGIYGEIGLEEFAYVMADCPDIIDALLEYNMHRAIAWIEHIPEAMDITAVFAGDDIAYTSGPLFSPRWFAEHYFERFARVMDAYHRRRIKVLFHSDGDLNPILDGLVEAGIDGLNPIEVLAGMDVAEIHRRYPDLFMAGAIDVSQLLPYGSPDEVKDAVRRTIDAAEGKIMIGSSTELNNEVPLANYLALREAVLEHRPH